jgi:hypothetical protein
MVPLALFSQPWFEIRILRGPMNFLAHFRPHHRVTIESTSVKSVLWNGVEYDCHIPLDRYVVLKGYLSVSN